MKLSKHQPDPPYVKLELIVLFVEVDLFFVMCTFFVIDDNPYHHPSIMGNSSLHLQSELISLNAGLFFLKA